MAGMGRIPIARNAGRASLIQGITALQSLMDDCATVVDSQMHRMGHCLHQPRIIDTELNSLSPHELVMAKMTKPIFGKQSSIKML